MGHPGLLYFPFHLSEHEHLLQSLVGCYRGIFATAPWSEWKKCGKCEKVWGIEQKDELVAMNFHHCGHLVEDFHTVSRVVSDIKEATEKKASIWVAATKDDVAGKKVVGFVWGYPVSPSELAAHLEVDEFPAILQHHFGEVAEVAYLAEMGVLPEFRGHEFKVAKRLAIHRFAELREMGLKVGVVRTKTNPPSKTYTRYKKEGYKVIYEYRDLGGRVIQARGLEDHSIHIDD